MEAAKDGKGPFKSSNDETAAFPHSVNGVISKEVSDRNTLGRRENCSTNWEINAMGNGGTNHGLAAETIPCNGKSKASKDS